MMENIRKPVKAIGAELFELDGRGLRIAIFAYHTDADEAACAINAHDALVAENEQLRTALVQVREFVSSEIESRFGSDWHICGPNSLCDVACTDRRRALQCLAQIDAALASPAPSDSAPATDDKDAEIARLRQRKDDAYHERNMVVATLAKLFPSGITRTAIEGWDPEWHGCVRIDLPTGQVSWHYHDSQAYLFAALPPYQGEWDGHTTEEKYARLAALTPGTDWRKLAIRFDLLPWLEDAAKRHPENTKLRNAIDAVRRERMRENEGKESK